MPELWLQMRKGVLFSSRQSLAIGCSIFTVALAAIALVGWITGYLVFARLKHDHIVVEPLTPLVLQLLTFYRILW
jgi:hypothetical protein